MSYHSVYEGAVHPAANKMSDKCYLAGDMCRNADTVRYLLSLDSMTGLDLIESDCKESCSSGARHLPLSTGFPK